MRYSLTNPDYARSQYRQYNLRMQMRMRNKCGEMSSQGPSHAAAHEISLCKSTSFSNNSGTFMFRRLSLALHGAVKNRQSIGLRCVSSHSNQKVAHDTAGQRTDKITSKRNPSGKSATNRNVSQSEDAGTPLWTVVFWSVNAFLAAHLIFEYVFTFRPTTGPSMLPTINVDGDWVFIAKYYRRGRGVQIGDVVSYEHPMRRGYRAMKRVVAMPGDFVLRDTPERGEWMVQVPEGHCWVAGDNLEWSRDSRHFGPLPLALIKGRALFKISTSSWLLPKRIAWLDSGLTDID